MSDEPCMCWSHAFTCMADQHDDTCTCGHALNWHDMGHGCIECRCRGYVDTPATAPDTLT